jgi:hypothetical protein
MKSLGAYLLETEKLQNYAMPGDGFGLEINNSLSLDTHIIEVFEDGILINTDDTAYNLLAENGCTFEDQSPMELNASIENDHVGEGYKVMPPMDDKYQPRNGLEGPFTTLSGKVVYYDPREGSYYDPDTDIYMSYDEFQNYDKDYTDMRSDEDMGSDADEARLKVASTLDAQEGPVDEAGCSNSRLRELAGLPETTIKDRDAYDASEPGDKKKITLPKAPWEKDKEVNEAGTVRTMPLDSIDWPDSNMLQTATDAIRYDYTSNDAFSHLYSMHGDDHGKWLRANEDDILAMFSQYSMDESIDEESDAEMDDHAERAGKEVAHDAHYDGRKHSGRDGKDVTKDLEYDDYKDHHMDEAEYQGRKVKLNKPMRGDVKKSKVYVKDPKTGNTKKVNFGDPDMKIKKSNPKRRKSFRARHNCENPGPKTKARYWSCRAW